VYDSVAQAWQAAIDAAQPEDTVLVCGSFHTVAHVMEVIDAGSLESSTHITNLVFSILRNARALHVGEAPNMVVCWGGHSINENE
ncbi:hypothetical protein MJN47_29595, partial [Salmonella enterica subsp. enterica serovar Lubbock]|nr:hypothetical protein [Salmonella enterica subsp. enterica serovar Lubbock]